MQEDRAGLNAIQAEVLSHDLQELVLGGAEAFVDQRDETGPVEQRRALGACDPSADLVHERGELVGGYGLGVPVGELRDDLRVEEATEQELPHQLAFAWPGPTVDLRDRVQQAEQLPGQRLAANPVVEPRTAAALKLPLCVEHPRQTREVLDRREQREHRDQHADRRRDPCDRGAERHRQHGEHESAPVEQLRLRVRRTHASDSAAGRGVPVSGQPSHPRAERGPVTSRPVPPRASC